MESPELGTRKPEEPKQAIHVVRNGTTGQPEPGYGDNEEQRDGRSSASGEKAAAETTDMFAPDASIDYLDIPAFLRNQAD